MMAKNHVLIYLRWSETNDAEKMRAMHILDASYTIKTSSEGFTSSRGIKWSSPPEKFKKNVEYLWIVHIFHIHNFNTDITDFE